MLEARDLSASYGKHRALEGASLRVDRGEIVVILGANGAGKSTLLKAISGICEGRVSGSVTMNGHQLVGEKPDRIVEEGIALVPEGRGIFGNLSVHENLVMAARPGVRGQQDWTYQRVLDTFPRLGERLGHGGQQLSGGEQQMLSIGRALMTNPDLLLLDEATSALDAHSERMVQAALEKAMQGRTTLVIAHRLATVQQADVIWVLDHGRLVEQGTHLELVAKAGLYASLAALQFSQD